MTRVEKALLLKMREALMRRSDCRISSRTGLARCKQEVERITGKPLSDTPSLLAQQVYGFHAKQTASALAPRPFKPLIGYEASLWRLRDLAEATR